MKIIEEELNQFNKKILDVINKNRNQISQNLIDFILSKSKRIRPSLIFLTAKSLNINISKEIMNIAIGTELIHNATLIHDDIIDNADIRRGKLSLNAELGNNLSVLAGDLILTFALKELIKCNNFDILQAYACSLENMCNGEINQHFSLNKIPSVEEYIEKSQNKTAELFKASLKALCIQENIKEKDNIENFASYFGIAFQIKDDLKNILLTDNTKPGLSDIYNGIYTLPVIILSKKKDIKTLSKEAVIGEIHSNQAIIKETKDLIKKYAQKAIDSLTFISDNQYKNKLIEITENLYEAE